MFRKENGKISYCNNEAVRKHRFLQEKNSATLTPEIWFTRGYVGKGFDNEDRKNGLLWAGRHIVSVSQSCLLLLS